MKSICGMDCGTCELRDTCRGCCETGGRPFGADCMVAACCRKGGSALNQCKEALIAAFRALSIQDMEEVTDLIPLKGSFANLTYRLPNGQAVTFWDDNRIYLGTQVRKKGTDRYYGLLADEICLMVSEYSGAGTDGAIVAFRRWNEPPAR